MSTMLDIARQYVAAGLSVIPIEHRGKHPHGRLLAETTGITTNWTPESAPAAWRTYCGRMPTDEELIAWFEGSDAGIGIVGGQISGGLIRIDLEHVACLPTWHAALAADSPSLAFDAKQLPIVETLKGHHVYFRMPDPPGHVLLCVGGSGDGAIVFAETQGEGCYCVAPPSMGHRSVASAPYYEPFSYAWIGGSIQIPRFPQELANALLDAARFDGLWSPTFPASFYPRGGLLHRQGLTLLEEPSQSAHGIWFGWEHLHALRAYLDRYEALLRAVESAPPPPPSYDSY